jgi:hypothetical protein
MGFCVLNINPLSNIKMLNYAETKIAQTRLAAEWLSGRYSALRTCSEKTGPPVVCLTHWQVERQIKKAAQKNTR